jgi:hypothetical protein
VYILEALSHNRLLKPGDQIAIATPMSAQLCSAFNVMLQLLMQIAH